jgi:xanthine dehydrogenase accessory factor
MPVNDNRYLSGIICEQLGAGSPVVLASIVSMEGSIPRGSGTKMVVGADGTSYGTVGGSLLEATVIADSAAVLTEKRSRFVDFDLTGSDAASEDMICGGKTVLLLDYIPASGANRELFEQMNEFVSKGSSFYFLTGFTEPDDSIEIAGHCLLFHNGRTIGDSILPESDVSALREELHNISSTTILSVSDKKLIIDPIRKIKTLYCFGAGHVALPTAHIASMVGFKVTVIDDRDEFANADRFPDADEIRVIDDFGKAMEGLEIDSDSFIIILTRGHKFDRVVLEQALKTDAGYIGMISSRNKRDSVYKALIDEGVATVEDLERVHSPIGLAIGGETPEEIAVSIVAEMIYNREQQS